MTGCLGINDRAFDSCGDGEVQGEEECDDGNLNSEDECTELCLIAQCGDGFIHRDNETCDDGNQEDGDGCNNVCIIE